MRLEHYSEQRLREQVREIIGKYLDLKQYRIFFFGSRVEKTNTPRSDIDLGIEGPEEIPGDVRVKILEELEDLPTLYRFDLVDFKRVEAGFKKEALRSVEYVV